MYSLFCNILIVEGIMLICYRCSCMYLWFSQNSNLVNRKIVTGNIIIWWVYAVNPLANTCTGYLFSTQNIEMLIFLIDLIFHLNHMYTYLNITYYSLFVRYITCISQFVWKHLHKVFIETGYYIVDTDTMLRFISPVTMN